MEEPAKTNKLSIASVVLAVLSAPSLYLLGPVYIFTDLHMIPLCLPILPFFLGIIAIRQIHVSNGMQKGESLALTGVIVAMIEFLITCVISVITPLPLFLDAITH